MNKDGLIREHEEIDLLLPWYVNETLDPGEHDRVALHVASCIECQETVSTLTEMQAAVVKNKATPIVPRPRVDDLLESISSRRILHRLDRRQATTFVAAAAATLILVVTLLIAIPDSPTGISTEFETATSNRGAISMEYVLRIQFRVNSSEAERIRILQDIGARDISGGSAEGSYRAIVQLSAASLEELERYTDSLESLSEVASVEVVALQLPMKTKQ